MTTYSVNSYAQLVSAMNAANASASDDEIYVMGDITLTGKLPTIGARSASGAAPVSGALSIRSGNFNGSASTISGAGAYQIFAVDSGAVTLRNLNLVNGLGKGGDGETAGTGGGGGLGAGGALLVNTGATVTLDLISFSGNKAVGGAGGGVKSSDVRGSGGRLDGTPPIYIASEDDFGRGGYGNMVAPQYGGKAKGGFGAGVGGDFYLATDGGAGFGGAVFARTGSTLILSRVTASNDAAVGGARGVNTRSAHEPGEFGMVGDSLGDFLYTQGDAQIQTSGFNLNPTYAEQVVVGGVLTKMGDGRLTLGAFGRQGQIVMSAGVLEVGVPKAITGAELLMKGGAVQFDVGGGASYNFRDLSASYENGYVNNFVLQAPAGVTALTLIGPSTGPVAITGAITQASGAAPQSVEIASGYVILDGEYFDRPARNVWTGPTVVSGGAVLEVSDPAHTGSGALVLGSDSAMGALVLHQTPYEYQHDHPSFDMSRAITLKAGGGGVSIVDYAVPSTLSGVISGAGALSLGGAGAFTISGANTYSGGTVLRDQVIASFTAAGSAGTGSITFTGVQQQLTLAPTLLTGDAQHVLPNAINGFGADGDSIDIKGVGVADSATWSASTHLLTLKDAGGTALASAYPAFEGPMHVWCVMKDGSVRKFTAELTGKESRTSLATGEEPAQVVVNPTNGMLCVLNFNPPAAMTLAQATDGPTAFAKLQAIDRLASSGNSKSRDALASILKDQSLHYGIRSAAAASLGKMDTPEARDNLLAALKDGVDDPKVRRAVVSAVGDYKDASVAKALMPFAQHDDSLFVEAAALAALGNQRDSDAIVELLVKKTDDAGWAARVRQAAVGALADLGDARGIEPAEKLAAYGGPFRGRSTGISALGKLYTVADDAGKKQVREFLVGLIHDPQQRHAVAAIRTLAALGDKEAIPPLQRLANGSAPDALRDAATGAIRKINAGGDESSTVQDLRRRLDRLEDERDADQFEKRQKATEIEQKPDAKPTTRAAA